MKTIVMIAAIALSMQASGRTANAPEGYCIPEACQRCDCRRITGLPESNGIAGTIDNGHRPWNPCYPCPARPVIRSGSGLCRPGFTSSRWACAGTVRPIE